MAAKTTPNAVGDILNLNPANGTVLTAATVSESWEVRTLEQAKAGKRIANLQFNHDALVKDLVKEVISNNVTVGPALVAIYNFGGNLENYKQAQVGISAHRDRPFRPIVTGDFGRS